MSDRELKRDFKGIWIPKEIWLNSELSLQEKVMLVEIDSLDNEDGCWASNGYFAEFFGISKQRVSQIINSLKKKGYITIRMVYGDGKNIEKRIIRVSNIFDRGIKYSKGGIKYSKGGYQENFKDNNTIINNTSNTISTTESSIEEKDDKKEKKIIIDVDLIMNEWNNLHDNIPKIKKVSKSTMRYKSLRARCEEYGEDEVVNCIKRINKSSFLQGFNDRKWTVTFDWMLKPNNFIKVLEGNYDDVDSIGGEYVKTKGGNVKKEYLQKDWGF